jgi:sulfur carrier protein
MQGTLSILLNGQNRAFPNLQPSAPLTDLIAELALKSDRIAVEHNGDIIPRTAWADTPVATGDRLEIVHFVGGGQS